MNNDFLFSNLDDKEFKIAVTKSNLPVKMEMNCLKINFQKLRKEISEHEKEIVNKNSSINDLALSLEVKEELLDEEVEQLNNFIKFQGEQNDELEIQRRTETLVKRLKKEAVPSVFPWTNTFASPSSLQRATPKTRREENKSGFDTDSDTSSEENNITEWNEELDSLDVGTTSQNPVADSDSQTQTWPALCVEKFEDDPAGMKFYTGLQSHYDFTFVLASLREAAYKLNYLYFRSEQLSVENQFFLTLVKLRKHKTNFELSRLFNISETAVINIWITWINFMYHQWKEINIYIEERDLVRFSVLITLDVNFQQPE
ncbi:unnamed protein product [Mytilus coruscus]|uniref:Transposase Helix-turn-helix domain-containing protein n=1 Tax=Mytilus coruscus TaxID=42192 RepID=A0A6J8BWR0_MYTCO|nr:unnamed protein product [Mytilus coruscus]